VAGLFFFAFLPLILKPPSARHNLVHPEPRTAQPACPERIEGQGLGSCDKTFPSAVRAAPFRASSAFRDYSGRVGSHDIPISGIIQKCLASQGHQERTEGKMLVGRLRPQEPL